MEELERQAGESGKEDIPFFSVVIPAYNVEHYIGATLRSVLEQEVGDYEIVVVNDGSTDGTADVVRSIRSDKIRLIDQPNKGAAGARNTGVRAARGRYVAFLDGDDYWYPDHLTMTLNFFRQCPHIKAYVTRSVQAPMGHVLERDENLPDFVKARDIGVRGFLSMHSSNVIFLRELLLSLPPWEEGMKYAEDSLYWMRVRRKAALIGIRNRAGSIYFAREGSAVMSGAYAAINCFDLLGPLIDELRSMRGRLFYFAFHFAIIREFHPRRLMKLTAAERGRIFDEMRALLLPVVERPLLSAYQKILENGDLPRAEEALQRLQKRILFCSETADRILRWSGLIRLNK